MPKFPLREVEIIDLGQAIIQGMTTQAAIFPKQPFSLEEVRACLESFISKRDRFLDLQAQAAEASTAKQAGLDTLTDTLKAILRYVENAAVNEDQLAHFGWSGRRPPTALQVPGQCLLLEALRQGIGWVFLDWKEPADGGKPGFYIVEVRDLPDGEWKHAATVAISEARIENGGNGKVLEYRVYAANKAGNGPASNIVQVRG